jgi:hypothetical protein
MLSKAMIFRIAVLMGALITLGATFTAGVSEAATHSSVKASGRDRFARIVLITKDGTVVPLVTGCTSTGCTINNVDNGLCWSDLGQTGNGAKISYQPCDPNSKNQQWGVVNNSNGTNSLVATAADRCLNDPNGGTGNPGPQLQLWNCYTTNYEDFYFGGNTSNPVPMYYWGNLSYCLSDNGETYTGAPLVTDQCNVGGNNNQHFDIAGF